MVIIHFGPNPIPDTAFGNLYEVPHGRASVLFVLLAGVGVPLLAAGRSDDGRRWQARGRLLFRAALLLPLGLWLQGLDHGVLVILQYYAVYFLLAALVLALPDLWLLLAATACMLWRAVLPRGPLEAVLATPWLIIERVAAWLRTSQGRDARAPVAVARGSREWEK